MLDEPLHLPPQTTSVAGIHSHAMDSIRKNSQLNVSMTHTPSPSCTICTHCGARLPIKTSPIVYYSSSSVGLLKCKSCLRALDSFWEEELVLVVLGLALHRVGAFRHVVGNGRIAQRKQWMRFALATSLIESLGFVWVRNERVNVFGLARYFQDKGNVMIGSQGRILDFMGLAEMVMASLGLLAVQIGVFMITAWGVAGRRSDREFFLQCARAVVLARFPLLLFILAAAFSYPIEFYFVISLFAFSSSISASLAIPGIDKLPKALFVAFVAALPKIAGHVFL